MRSFEVPGMRPAAFVGAMRSKLVNRQLDRYVVISLDGDSLVVEMRWMGTTRFDFTVSPMDDGFRAELVGQRVAPIHAAFSDRFDHYFIDALGKVGAKVI